LSKSFLKVIKKKFRPRAKMISPNFTHHHTREPYLPIVQIQCTQLST